MTSAKTVARRLAAAIACGRLNRESVLTRAGRALGRPWNWLGPFAKRLTAHFGPGSRPLRRNLERFVLADEGFRKACLRHALVASPAPDSLPEMAPVEGPPETWNVPVILCPADLARRLNVSATELAWWADLRRQERHLPLGPLRHYWYGWRSKRGGSVRLIESPKQRLKAIQRVILCEIIERIPPHSAAHGFRRGRSIVTHATPHAGRCVVLKMDLKDFFPSVRSAQIGAVFMTAGYPERVARTLAGLCVNSAPVDVLRGLPGTVSPADRRRFQELYQRAHLPQGAPSSPALANLAAYRLDCRLSGLARNVGATYTRYADDLLFSGDEAFARRIGRFRVHVSAIAIEEGFEMNERKTRVMRRSVGQRAVGLVLNERLNVPRRHFDELKAILHNCIRYGPQSQNRVQHPNFAAHLAGRIAHVEQISPARGARLRSLFERISWET